MKSWIKRNRQSIEQDLKQENRWKYFSPAILLQYKITLPMILRYARLKLLDVGCGTMPFRPMILPYVTDYDGMDLYPKIDAVRYVCDAQDMNEVGDESYDTVICLEVLEHLPDPQRALKEIFRVLKTGGILIASVPHLSRIHDAPHDFYRYTNFGIQWMMEQAGFSILELVSKGGLFSFLGHQFSTIFLALFWKIPILKEIAYQLNAWLISRLCIQVDHLFDRSGTFALGYAFAAVKNES